MVSSIDVAKYAGVSQTTVSRVLNTPHLVKEKTYKKVMRAIDELSYIPNGNARSLVRQKTGTIALISGPLSNPFFVDTTTSIINYASQYGYKVNVHFATDGNLEETYSSVFENKVDGIILSSILIEDPFYHRMVKSAIPFIFFNRKHESNQYFVEMDNEKAGELATSHLLALGHKKIAWVGGPSNMSTFKSRFDGYLKAFQNSTANLDSEYIFLTNNATNIEVDDIFEKIESMENKPSAICAATDAIAISLINCFIAAGYDVPEDISIIGIDDVELSKHASINLTTVGVTSSLGLGQLAIEKLIHMIEDKDNTNVQITTDVKLVERKTVKGISR